MRKFLFLVAILSMAIGACNGDEGTEGSPAPATEAASAPTQTAEMETATGTASGEPVELTLMTHDSFDASEEVLESFEAEHNITLTLLPAGDTGTALNQAILAKQEPLADVFYGVDNTFLSRALDENLFEPYESPLLAEIPDRFELDASNHLLPVDFGDVCLNYDVGYFAENELAPPESLEVLVEPEYESLLVTENPATSSPGLAFMLATIGHFGTEGDYTWINYWSDLRDNDVLVTNDWTEAYYGQFTVASDGNRPLVVSYASSPPAEVIFADPPVDTAPSASVTAPDTCFRQIEFVGILQGTEKREAAEALVDFILSERFQEDIPLNMFVFPVNENAELPPEFIEWAEIPETPATVSPEAIDANREEWIQLWTDTVLR